MVHKVGFIIRATQIMNALTMSEGLRLLSQRQYKQAHEKCLTDIQANVQNPIPYFLLKSMVIMQRHWNCLRKLRSLIPKQPIIQLTLLKRFLFLGDRMKLVLQWSAQHPYTARQSKRSVQGLVLQKMSLVKTKYEIACIVSFSTKSEKWFNTSRDAA